MTDTAEMHLVYELAAPSYAYILSVQETTPVIETGNITRFASVGIDTIANPTMRRSATARRRFRWTSARPPRTRPTSPRAKPGWASEP